MKKFLFALMGLIISLPSWAASCDYVITGTNAIAILFDRDQTDVKDCAKTEFIQAMKKIKDIYTITLIGSTDSTGSNDYNIKLAERRTGAVKAILRGAGYSDWIINTYVAGESDLRRSLGDNRDWLGKRSVHIIVKQDHVSAICSNEKVTQAISGHPTELKELSDACEAGLDNNKIIEILLRLDQSYGLGDIANAYKLYAELLKDTEDLRSDTSVWRTADGKFNTARLASDSIAGVVLGTVGGVVTSTIMKKSQIRNGLEYIKCVVGGQTVASYDDQFSVGLK